MTTVTMVVAADSDVTPGVLDLLRDWSAINLVQSFVWIDEADIGPDVPLSRLPVTVLDAGDIRRVGLGEHLANQHDVELVRIAVLSAAGPGGAIVASDRAQKIWNDVQGAFSGRVVPLHCIVTRHGGGGWDPQACWLGWQNIVLAPEQAWDPTEFREVLYAGSDDAEFVSHAACGLLAVSGLWLGMQRGPLDQVREASTGTAIVARAYVRRLDAGAVASSVISKTTDLSRGLPRPHTVGRARLDYLEDVEGASQEIAAGLQDKYKALFESRRDTPTAAPPRPITLMQAVRMFLTFLLAAIKGAPRTWLDQVVTSAAARVAGSVQHTVFGDQQSAYRVTLLGRDSSGRLADIEAVTAGNEQIASGLRQNNVNVDMSLPDLGPFWRDFVGGALTLADGGAHVSGIEPVNQGPNPGIVRYPSAIAPPPTDRFQLSSTLAAHVHAAPIESADAFTALRVRKELRRIADQDPILGTAAAQQLETLEGWFRPHSRTYIGRIGDRIARFSLDSWDAIEANRQLVERTRQARAVDANIERAQERQARRQVGLLVGLVLALVAAVALVIVSVLTLVLGAIIAVVCLLVWFVGALMSFMRGQRELFQVLHQREQNVQEAEVALRNLGYAVSELNRATVMYTQFLCWAAIVGAFLTEPFGRREAQPPPLPPLRGELPRSFGLGIAVADEDKVDKAVARVRSRLFEAGWLGGTWDRFLTAMPSRVGRVGHELVGHVDSLFTDKARGDESPLRLWADDVRASGVDPQLGDAMIARAHEVLVRESGPQDFAELLGRVVVLAQQHHDIKERSALQFLGDLASSARADRASAFDLALFTPRAQSQGSQTVKRTVVCATDGAYADLNGQGQSGGPARSVEVIPAELGLGRQQNLDQLIVVVQCADPVTASLLTLAASDTGGGERYEPLQTPLQPGPSL